MKKVIYILFLLLAIVYNPVKNVYAETGDDIFEKNAYRIVRKIDAEGRISLTYIFPLNSEILMENFTEKQYENYKLYLALYVNSLAKNNEQKAVSGVNVSGCVYYEDVDGIGFSVMFDSSKAQQNFFGVSQNENGEQQKRKTSGLFIKKMSIEATFPVSSSKVAGDLKMVSILAISSWSRENDIELEKKNLLIDALSKAIYIYDFATTQNSLKSEKMYSENGFFHNVFTKTASEIEENNKIVFYVELVDRGLIYICLIVVVIIGMAIAFIIAKRKRKIWQNSIVFCAK